MIGKQYEYLTDKKSKLEAESKTEGGVRWATKTSQLSIPNRGSANVGSPTRAIDGRNKV